MIPTALRRLTVLAVVTGLAAPGFAAPAHKKAVPATVAGTANAAALQAALLAVKERLYALQEKKPASATDAEADVTSKPVPASHPRGRDAEFRLLQAQQAEINELRGQIAELRTPASAARGTSGGVKTVAIGPQAPAQSGTQAAQVQGAPGQVPATPDQPEAAAAPGQQNMVSVKSAPADASVQSVYQQQNALFVRKLTLTPSVTHTYSDNRFFTLNGFLALGAIFLGNVNVTQQRSDITMLGLNGTYGLSDRAELEAQVPYFNRSTTFASAGANDAASLPSQDRVQSSGIGDVLVGGYYQVNRESGTTPGVTVNGHVSLPTGRAPYGIKLRTDASNSSMQFPGSLPTGSGTMGYEVGASFVKTSDPAIFFGGANVYYNQATHFNDLSTDPLVRQPGTAQPGKALQYQLGTAFALNEKTSLSFAFDDVITNDAVLRPMGGKAQSVIGSGTNAAYLSISAGYARNPHQTVITEFDLGLTQDAPNFQLNIRLPHRF